MDPLSSQPDNRLDYLSSFVQKSLKLKSEKWMRMMNVEDNKAIVKKFLERPMPTLLIIYLTQSAQLVAASSFPLPQMKSKGVYFVKKAPIPVPKQNPSEVVIPGDLSCKIIDQLASFVDEVVLSLYSILQQLISSNTIHSSTIPILSNPANHQSWPAVIAKDVHKHVISLKNTVYQVKGQVNGQTVLPMPVGIEKVSEVEKTVLDTNGETCDLYLKSAIEGMVIKWASQINDVLANDSSEKAGGCVNPVPTAEIEFWKLRLKNLQYIYEQLKEPKVKSMAVILEKTNSAYYSCFTTLFRNTVTRLSEAQDVCVYLTPLKKHINSLEETDFSECVPLIAPTMHVICLIWTHCKSFDQPKLITLLKQVCNLLIQEVVMTTYTHLLVGPFSAKKFLDATTLFHSDIDEAMQRVNLCIKTLKHFSSIFNIYKNNLHRLAKDGIEPKSWTFSPNSVFERFDAFQERLQKIRWFFNTVMEFNKLEKLEIGGMKGKTLSAKVVEVHGEFQQCFAGFSGKSYDVLEPDDSSFDADFENFKKQIFDMDMKLATILCQAFEDCSNLDSTFKLISISGSLLERPLIKQEFVQKYVKIVDLLDTELEMVMNTFEQQMQHKQKTGQYVLDKYMPPVAGTLRWTNNLSARLAAPLQSFKALQHPIVEHPRALSIITRAEKFLDMIKEFNAKMFNEWAAQVPSQIESSLKQCLLEKNSKTNELNMNFNPQLMGQEHISEDILKLSEKDETLQKYISVLTSTVTWYNTIKKSSKEVEFDLIEKDILKIDKMVEIGEKDLNWESADIWTYLTDLHQLIGSLHNNLQKCQDNLQAIKDILVPFARQPLFERRDGKKDAFLDIENKEEILSKRKIDLTNASVEVKRLLEENMQIFGMTETQDHQKWVQYIDFVDGIITSYLYQSIGCSLGYINEHMDPSNNLAPLFECQLELLEPDIVFTPSLDPDNPRGLKCFVKDLIEKITETIVVVDRFSNNKTIPYKDEVASHKDIVDIKDDILKSIDKVIEEAYQFSDNFDNYSYLWLDDRHEYLYQFLNYGRQLTFEELEYISLKDSLAPKPSPPRMEQFREQIDNFENIWCEVEKMKESEIFHKWYKLDVRPFKQALLNTIRKWGNMFKEHLVNTVTNSLSDLSQFIRRADEGLQQTIAEGDYEYYDQDIPEEVNVYLQELPEQWNNTKKIAVTVKQQVAPLQAAEVACIRKRIVDFDHRVTYYREVFKRYAFFRYDCTEPYQMIDRVDGDLRKLEKEMKGIHESGSLFEVNVPDFKILKQCRRDLRLLKQLWDYVHIVHSCVDDWKTTAWRKIDVENMDIECKKFAKEVKMLDKEMRVWDTYIGLESTVKNTLTSLKAVGELQNPAIRERHWDQLMTSTKTRIVMDANTTLADLLELNLHECEEEVKNIVDKAVKEMSMEKTLRELNATWSAMEFEQELHARTGCTLLRASEELIETLEENQVQMQNLITSKFIAHFLEEVSSWQYKLGLADQVISIWFEVQRTWMHLESIFMSSEDIRKQLPEDSARFDNTDKNFKKLMKEMAKIPNVIESTNRPGLLEVLEDYQKDLTLCEKALAVYLETKRLAFPRFYFVSSADLLDVLSNGNQPELVVKHLTKLFDSVAKLDFGKNEDNTLDKTIIGMYAKDGEYVRFNQTTSCEGPVEVWLNRVQDSMRCSIRLYIGDGVLSYEEKPRDQWLFDFPAQVSLCGTQIWWTTEVNIAFSRLEEGYDNALRDYYKKQVSQLSTLISLLLGDLSKQDRQKIMTICTIDVHSRDVVGKLIQMKVESASAFPWVSQLRHRWQESEKQCYANICDAQFRYSYEYLGNTPRLVITPLTDRCYITLTQSLHLVMGGGPAGPAGTGKTETTKDLGRALGIMVYVFNCSEQMDYKSCGNIYKGLAQTGAWGCFDEFNRISVEVLSVVAVQVKSVLDAIKNKKITFDFMGDMINLVPTVGIFITMNPGYAGRTELPENLKALFRPCAMVVPDFELICEIMLVAEGFQEAKILARKFITLYTLCKELLSKQDHYDWGLRAIKSVLVVAGSLKFLEECSLKGSFYDNNSLTQPFLCFMQYHGGVIPQFQRGDPGRPEEEVLMRALRDFNVPKIVTDDTPVFMGLIGDLFPALEVPRKRDAEFERTVKQAAIDLKLQPEDNFILKVVQLEELLEVRHSVFIVGNAGTGKTEVWKTLFKTYVNIKRKPVYNDLNPKAVTNDELFGIINPATREWKDGLLSVLMRDQANLQGDNPKWIVLDGDIDPMWIESLNTVMDDNKVLTLASNERIALTPTMRLLFEISNLRTATPATVSRAGILYINPQDLGWNPYVTSWIDTRENQTEKSNLIMLFDKYIPICLENVRTRFKKITPITETSHLAMLCHLLECLLTPNNVPPDCPKELYELYFVFCCVWAFGSAMFQEQATDYRVEFTKWWVNEFKTVKFPTGGTVFDYYIDFETKQFVNWTESLGRFELDPDVPLQAVLVHTAESIRIRYFLDLLMEKRNPVMLVGTAGCGKTVLVKDKLGALPENYAITNVPFNFYTSSEMLQKILEKPLEKKAGRNYGPPGNKTMVYFIDDMNMPEVDGYGTVQPHTLIRQHLDYNHWYDRNRLTLKEIHNCQYVACMNPTAGSFTINPRLQRHFCVFAIRPEALNMIYHSILSQHLTNPEYKFPSFICKLSENVVNASVALHHKVSQIYLPTAVKFHYIFNLRDISNVFQGLLFSTNDCLNQPFDLVRLWVHECQRVYGDKLTEEKDIDSFSKLQLDIFKKNFEEIDESIVFEKPNIYCHFAGGIGEPKYMPIKKWLDLSKLLNEALSSYNDLVAAMNLVLFEDAMMHICRINRILESPRGSALLVGVGGSGKQSLARLAAFISSLEVSQIQLKKGYGVLDLKKELAVLYLKSGLKNVGIMFLMTDAQVPNEQFLVLINDMLASGEVPDMFPDDEIENIIAGVRNEVKGAGILDTRENCWKFFIERVRRQLKVVLCFSPVGSTLRVRSRKFPAIINCTQINWFHEWPQEALVSVSLKFLQEVSVLPENLRDSAARFMAYAHTSVNTMSKSYLQNERRYNYTTPKSYLEQITLYSKLLNQKAEELESKIKRLENGLEKLRTTATQVDELKKKLAVQEVELKEKNEAADELIKIVGIETEKVSIEKNLADEEEEKVAIIAEEVTKKQKDCEEDLRKAEPALIAAQEALNTLNKANLTELKSFGSPPAAVTNVTAAVMVLLSQDGKVPKDRSWKAAKIVMAKVDTFLDALINYDKENIHPEVIKSIEPYLKNPEFEPDSSWPMRLGYQHHKILRSFCDVEPKRKALAAANAELAAAREKLDSIKKKVVSLEEQLAKLTADFEKATHEKLLCQQEADATNATIQLANRLSEAWPVKMYDGQKPFLENGKMLPGDVLLTTAFISYVGCFTKQYRLDLLHKLWLPFFNNLDPPIPITENLDPLLLLTDDTIIAKAIKIGDKEIEYNPNFRLILHTKLANPHYKPEMQAQATLINFTVTRDGLEDQLLAEVTLEDDLLSRLSSAGGNLLGDTTLVENLETTKRTAAEIEQKVAEAKVTSQKIDQAREYYRPAAARASLLYFILNDLNMINPIYQFSLKAFSVVFQKAIAKADPAETVAERVNNLISCISFSVFQYTTRGLFECDKLIFASQMTFQILLMNEEIQAMDLDFLLRFPIKPHVSSPVDFLSNNSWGGICSLATKDEFRNLDRDIENNPKRWKKLVECECPEKENKYVENKTLEFEKSFEEASQSTPIFFILSPGVNPLKDVEELGEKLGFTLDKGNFHNVSLGQGQEVVAEKAMEVGAKNGHWVVLQNIHLVKKWLPALEKNLEKYAEGSHPDYRVFMSAEPAASPTAHIIPQGILESSIKITNEPPTGRIEKLTFL
nr:unnamed protein product [Callosobruchus analis]